MFIKAVTNKILINIGKYPIANEASANLPYPPSLVVYIAAAIQVIPNNIFPESVRFALINIYFSIYTYMYIRLDEEISFSTKKMPLFC